MGCLFRVWALSRVLAFVASLCDCYLARVKFWQRKFSRLSRQNPHRRQKLFSKLSRLIGYQFSFFSSFIRIRDSDPGRHIPIRNLCKCPPPPRDCYLPWVFARLTSKLLSAWDIILTNLPKSPPEVRNVLQCWFAFPLVLCESNNRTQPEL